MSFFLLFYLQKFQNWRHRILVANLNLFWLLAEEEEEGGGRGLIELSNLIMALVIKRRGLVGDTHTHTQIIMNENNGGRGERGGACDVTSRDLISYAAAASSTITTNQQFVLFFLIDKLMN